MPLDDKISEVDGGLFKTNYIMKSRNIKLKNLILLIGTFICLNVSYSQVSEQWVQRFTSDSIRDESVNDMFVDGQGNVYITGSQRSIFSAPNEIEAVTVKYNSQGVQQWIQNYRAVNNNGAFGRAIHVDAAGNVYVTGESAIYSGGANRALVIKYSPSGTQLWSYLFAYSTAYNGGYDIITDLTGNVYVTGEYATNVITYNNIFLVKFGPTGNLINQTFYHSASEGARKIALDGAGKIIIGGYINASDSLGFIALKYEQNLDFVWATRIGINIGNQNVIDMTVDINSNIILAGTEGTSLDYITVKINPSGNVVWRNLYNSATGWDLCKAVATDNSGNVYITGETGTFGFPLSYKMTTIKYEPNGNQQWITSDPGVTNDGFHGYNIAIDDSANVYVTGQSYSNSNIITVKYNTAGTLKWNILYNGTGNSTDIGVSVGVDNSGNTYVAGNSFGSGTGYDIAIIKYVPSSIGVQNISTEIPASFKLLQNYPNPFNPITKIRFSVTSDGKRQRSNVKLTIYNIAGNEVETLVNESLNPGTYEADWNASNYSSGVYFCKLQTEGFTETKKMLLTK